MDTLDVDKASLLPPERITHDLQGDAIRKMDLRTVGKGEAISHQGLTRGGAGSMETFTHGKVTLMHADCMEYMAGLEDKAFDLAIVDPPYFDGPQKPQYYAGTKQKTSVGSYKTLDSSWEVPGPLYFNELIRISKSQIIWGINYFNVALPGGRIVWVKGEQGSPFSMADIAYQSFYNRIDVFKHTWSGFWQEAGHKREDRIHPTQKPTALYEWLLTNYAKPNQRILDTHLGSASSAIAAHNLGFEFVGMELDADYYAAAVNRFNKAAAQQSMFNVYDTLERNEFQQADLL